MKKFKLIEDDSWLAPYYEDIYARWQRFEKQKNEVVQNYGSLEKYADAYRYFGINFDADTQQWVYREWAPQAKKLSLIGDFNQWDKLAHPLSKNKEGIWEIKLPKDLVKEGDKIKVHVVTEKGASDRIPAYIKQLVQDESTLDFTGVINLVEMDDFNWTDDGFKVNNTNDLLIYECHVGMSGEVEGMSTYKKFTDDVLPRIQRLGYNAIQVMAIPEHPYYGSFGYHVANFFAPSAKFGSPQELKQLINRAHEMGIAVILDVVHAHAVKNYAEGLNDFDGSGAQYFHPEPRGYHEHWDSKVFNYGVDEVKRFLLSNLKYWLTEFHVDGFRFDGVTSMLYFHHGMFQSFDHYDKYFKEGVEWDAITYLQLASDLCKTIKPDCVLIAEDMSGMPGMCKPINDGGLGFDYRLGMGIPDYWIKLIKEFKDEDWDLDELWGVLQNRRYQEKTIAYAESHDQAMVGDKTLAFWLMDKEMYFGMAKDQQNLVVDRGLALHKMIRLLTITAGGEAYLNFMGNEFGHPEWIDFPREGNGWSYKNARRQWSLVDNQKLKYHFLNDFDQAMIQLVKQYQILPAQAAQLLHIDVQNKVLIYERNHVHFVLNFSPNHAIQNYHFPVIKEGTYRIVLSTDEDKFGGFNRVDTALNYVSFKKDGQNFVSIYLTNRTALVLLLV